MRVLGSETLWKQSKKSVFLVSCLACSASLAFASTRDFSTENEWGSSQINALGGVGHMSEEMVDQFFSDPSLPVQRKAKFELQLSSLHAMYSKDLKATVSDAQELQSESSGDSGASQTVELLDKVRSLFGRNLTGAANLTVLPFRLKSFMLVPYSSVFLDGGANVPSWPRANATVDSYAGLGLGNGFSLGKEWSLGVNLRPGVRGYAKVNASVADVGDFSSSSSGSSGTAASGEDSASKYASYGVGVYVPVDAGVGYLAGKSTRFNVVLRNIGGAPSLSTVQGTKPPVYPMRISLGCSTSIYQWGKHRVLGGTDLQDVYNMRDRNSILMRWQWAAQYLYTFGSRAQTTFGLNGGIRSGYPSVGLFVDLFLFKLEAAYFRREAGYYPGQRGELAYSFRAWSQMSF